MKSILRATTCLAAGTFMFAGLLTSCKKDDAGKTIANGQDTLYFLSGVRQNGVLADSLIYDDNALLKSINNYNNDGSVYNTIQIGYNKDNKVATVLHGVPGNLYDRDSLVYNSQGFTTHYQHNDDYYDTTLYVLNTDGQATLTGTKDTVDLNGDGIKDQVSYEQATLTSKNTTTHEAITYYGTAANYTTSSHKYVFTYTTTPNPFYAVYRCSPLLLKYLQADVEFAFDALNNPATATYSERYHVYPDNTDNNVDEPTITLTYTYDPVSGYPTQQSYDRQVSDNDGTHTAHTVITYTYKTFIHKK